MCEREKERGGERGGHPTLVSRDGGGGLCTCGAFRVPPGTLCGAFTGSRKVLLQQ